MTETQPLNEWFYGLDYDLRKAVWEATMCNWDKEEFENFETNGLTYAQRYILEEMGRLWIESAPEP